MVGERQGFKGLLLWAANFLLAGVAILVFLILLFTPIGWFGVPIVLLGYGVVSLIRRKRRGREVEF
jgi:hypothetical protein